MEILAVFNAKGGVGKTTTAVNLSACLAATGLRVVMIDLDSQGNATSNIGLPSPPESGTYDVISQRISIQDALAKTFMDGLSVIGATRTLAASDLDLAVGKRDNAIIRAAAEPIKDQVDVLVLDCPPTFGTMTTNALLSADAVLIPSQPNPFAHDGLLRTWTVLKQVRTKLNRDLKILGILPTFVSDIGQAAGESDHAVLDAMTAEFGDMVHPTGIPNDPALFARATADGLPAVVLQPDAPAALAYLTLALQMTGAGVTQEAGEAPRLLARLAGAPAPTDAQIDGAIKTLGRWRTKAMADGRIGSQTHVPAVDHEAIDRQIAVERERAMKGIEPDEANQTSGISRTTLIVSLLGTTLLVGAITFAVGWDLAGGSWLPRN